jgi:MFS family permease
MVMLGGIDAGDGYWTAVFPAAVVFGLGLAGLVAPVTATTLAAADDRHAGVASGVNNMVSRVAQLLATAGLPVLAGLTSDAADIPADQFAAGFARAMLISAGLAAAGAVIAWTRIDDEVLGDEGDGGSDDGGSDRPPTTDDRPRAAAVPADRWHCGVESAPERVRTEQSHPH